MSQKFNSIRYEVKDRVANIILNRPERMNSIDKWMPFEIQTAVQIANYDSNVKVILIEGAGKTFCSGYDLKIFAESERGTEIGSQKMPWDPYQDYTWMKESTEAMMSLFHSLKPTICKIRGFAVAGGSDIALCCDLIVMEENAKIGYPPSRIWGCPTTAMWTFRIGAQQAKNMLFTGRLIDGRRAQEIGLVLKSVPEVRLDDEVSQLISEMIDVPTNQLWMQKQVINQVVEMQGLLQSQRLSTLFDGISRHTPEGVHFQEQARLHGFKKAILERDSPLNKPKL